MVPYFSDKVSVNRQQLRHNVIRVPFCKCRYSVARVHILFTDDDTVRNLPAVKKQSLLRNRNRNFLPQRNRNRTVICNSIKKVLTGKVENCVSDFLHLTSLQAPLLLILTLKRQGFFTKKIILNCFLCSRYGAGNGTGTFQKSEPEP